MIPMHEYQSRARSCAILLVLALSGALTSAPVYAQIGGAANVGGAITDDSGAALPGVTVTITNTANGRAQSVVTGSDGRYRAIRSRR